MADQASLPKNIIAGGFSGACAILVGQPLDIIKLRLQTQPFPQPGQKPLYSGFLDCTLKTFRHVGFLGLYKGMSVPLMITTPLMATGFLGFTLGKNLQQKRPDEVLTSRQILAAGMLAGLFTSTITTPGERVKVLLQIQSSGSGPKLYHGPIDVAKALYRKGGIFPFYRGMTATLLRDIPGFGSFYLSYTLMRRALATSGKESDLSPLQIIIAGGTAGVTAWIVGIGPDVVKTRLQTAPEGKYPNGIRSVLAEMFQGEGLRALFKGTTPVVVRAFPANAALFLGYEAAMDFMNWAVPDL